MQVFRNDKNWEMVRKVNLIKLARSVLICLNNSLSIKIKTKHYKLMVMLQI